MAQTKLAGAWSYEDILTFPDDGRRYEIIEGDLYEMPSPTSVHAATSISSHCFCPSSPESRSLVHGTTGCLYSRRGPGSTRCSSGASRW